MTPTFRRDRFTWLAYLLLGFYGFFLNIFGPITPFIKSELALSYTTSSLHFSAFALGIIIIGLIGNKVIRRLGRWYSLWIGAAGVSLGAVLLIIGKSPVVTIGASFLMGLIGSLILVIIPSTLSDLHGEQRGVALSEANVVASLLAATAPLLVGWAIHAPGGWRLTLAAAGLAPVFLRLGFGRVTLPQPAAAGQNGAAARKPLPRAYWVYWTALFLAVSIEFCMIFWSADYLETYLGVPRVQAAQAVSLFLGGMIIGRFIGSRLVQRFPTHLVVLGATCLASIGFLLFWIADQAAFCLVGLFLTGLGVASIYPLILALALGTAQATPDQASARATLASGSAILVLPLVLGRLADVAGIHMAYSVVLVLLSMDFLIILATFKQRQDRREVVSQE